jgi:hypothetical protein
MNNSTYNVSASLEIVQPSLASMADLRRLSASQVLGLYAKKGSTIDCVDGSLWVTLEGDPEDHILNAGQALMLKSRGKVVVGAFKDASLRLA